MDTFHWSQKPVAWLAGRGGGTEEGEEGKCARRRLLQPSQEAGRPGSPRAHAGTRSAPSGGSNTGLCWPGGGTQAHSPWGRDRGLSGPCHSVPCLLGREGWARCRRPPPPWRPAAGLGWSPRGGGRGACSLAPRHPGLGDLPA